MEINPLQTRYMAPREVLALLRYDHDLLVEADEMERTTISEGTIVYDWLYWPDDLSRLWVSNARRLNRLFGISVKLHEWKPILNPPSERTLRDVCEFVSQRARVPEVSAKVLMGKPCNTAGAFLTIRSLFAERGADTTELKPSTPLSQYAANGLPETYKELERAAPSLMSRFSPVFRCDLGHRVLAAMLLLATIVIGIFAAAGTTICVPLTALTFGSFLLVWRSSELHVSKPYRVDVKGLSDFKDLSRVVACACKPHEASPAN